MAQHAVRKQLRRSLMPSLAALLLVVLCHPAAAETETETDDLGRIVGGFTTSISNVPYVVSLRDGNSFYCGGTIVSDVHIVTAAHCVEGRRAAEITVVGGTSFLSFGGVSRSVQYIILPSGYDSQTLNMDIAVLKLAEPMTGPNIEPIGLCDSTWSTGDDVQVSGWGLTSENGNVSNELRTVFVQIISRATCANSYQGVVELTNSMFCAADSGKDSCSGDSGGPVVYNNKLCGVVSFGVGCARSAYPGVYTNIRTTRNFLDAAFAI